MKKHHAAQCQLWLFCIVLSSIYNLTVVLSEFYGVPVSGLYSLAVTASQWLVVALCTCGLLSLMSASRWIFAATFPVLMTISGAMVYLNLTTGTRLTALSIELAMVNDAAMWWSMAGAGLLATVAVSAAAGIMTAIYRWKHVAASRRQIIATALAGAAVTAMPLALIKRIQAPVGARLPYSVYFATSEYLANRKTFSEERNTFATETPQASPTPPDVIFILGEALRADHLPQNGYRRNTMPLLSADTAVVSYPYIYSEHTHTYASVPHIMTRADSVNLDRAYDEESFITLLDKAGYSTAWFANQDLSRSYTYFAHECDTIFYCTSAASLYDYEKWLDTDMLQQLSRWLDTGTSPKLAVIHTIGSHWWYKSHYLDRHARFMPDITHKDVGGLSHEEMVNAYDNTIIATDEFLNGVLRLVEGRNAVVLYISDHGEALGEDGVYLHGTPVEPLHHPACLLWYSPGYAATFPDKAGRIKSNRGRHARTDAIFHTVLDIAGISTPSLDHNASLLYDETDQLD